MFHVVFRILLLNRLFIGVSGLITSVEEERAVDFSAVTDYL